MLLEFGVDDEAVVFPLTLRQARQLHDALDKLLATAERCCPSPLPEQ